MTDVGHHDASLGSLAVGVQENLVALGGDGTVVILHIVRHLDKLAILLAQVAHVQVVARFGTVFVEEHHGLLLVDADAVEALGVG